MHNQPRELQHYEDCQAKSIQELEWTSQGMDWDWGQEPPHTDVSRNLAKVVDRGVLNQIKSNHFYCHITTAQVPWWVKFLWACSRQCRKTTDNLHMDRQCTKTTNNLHMDRQCKKLHWSIYSAPDSAKKKNNSNLHMDRQCKKTTAIYIWTVNIYRLYTWAKEKKNSYRLLPGLRRRRTELLPSGTKSSFQMRASFVFHLETKVLETGGRVEKLIAQVAWSPVLVSTVCDDLGCNVICWCWSIVFFENQRHYTRLPRNVGALHASFCWPAF